jgi:hypothetical protein
LVPHWFAETYVKGYIQRKYRLVKGITLLVRSIAEGVGGKVKRHFEREKLVCELLSTQFVDPQH